MKICIDITHERGRTEAAVHALRQAAATHSPEAVCWLVRRDQVDHVGQDQFEVLGYTFSFETAADRVVQFFAETSRGEVSNQLCLFISYQGQFMATVARRARELGVTVVTTAVRAFAEFGADLYPAQITGADDERAADVMLTVLFQGRHFTADDAVRSTDLRPAMQYVDSSLKKDPTKPDSVGLIGRAVSALKYRGLIRSTVLGKSPAVYLTEAGQRVATALSENSLGRAVFAPDRLPAEADLKVESANLLKQRLPQADAAIQDSSESTKQGHEQEHELPLYKQFQAILNQRGIGSPPWARKLILKAASEILATMEEGMSVQTMFALARDRVLDENEHLVQSLAPVEESDPKRTEDLKKRWRATVNCVKNLCLAAGVLLGTDNTPIRGTFDSDSAVVARFEPDFEDLCDAYMLYYILRKRNDGIKLAERKALIRAVWGATKSQMRDEDDLDINLSRLFGILKRQGKTEETGDDRIVATDELT